MTAPIASLLGVSAYLVVAAGLIKGRREPEEPQRRKPLWLLALLGSLCHIWAVGQSLMVGGGLGLGVFNAASVLACTLIVIVILGSWAEPLDNLAIALLPAAALALSLDALLPSTRPVVHLSSFGIGVHVLTSLLAYSLFTLAALEALWLAVADKQLRQRRPGWVMSWLPSLSRMERLLFRLLGVGFVLLSVSLLSGAWYVSDLFAQHLMHKTILSVAAWLVFGLLLLGRAIGGWRGRTAVRFTFGGFGLLVLAYFGTKIVLELILHRT